MSSKNSGEGITRRDLLKWAGVTAGLAASGSLLEACAPKEAAPTPTVKIAKPVKLTLWHAENVPGRVEAFDKIIAEFREKNPDIEIVQETFGWPEAFAKIPAALSAGTGPDILHASPPLLLACPEGSYFPVGDIVAEIDEKYHYVEVAKKGLKWEGQTWLVPMYMLIHMLVYTSDMLEEAGFDEPPKTWDEWLQQCQAITKDGKYGIAIPTSKHLWTTQCLTDLMATNHGDVFDKEGNIHFNTPENVEAVRMYGELAKCAPPDTPAWTWAEGNLSLITGQSASSLIFGAPFARFIEEAPDRADFFKATTVPLPPGGKNAAVGGANYYTICTDDPAKREAFREFLLFLHEPEVNCRWLSTMQPMLFVPVTEAATKCKSYYEHPVISRYKDVGEVQMESAAYLVTYGYTEEEPNPLMAPIDGDVTLALVVQKHVIDGWTPEEAVEWGEERMKEITA